MGHQKNVTRALFSVVVVLLAALSPVAVNPYLRQDYVEMWVHYTSKAGIRPKYIFIGDSLTRWGGLWGCYFRCMNFAQSGHTTREIISQATRAADYRPDRVFVMSGTNDAVQSINPIEDFEALMQELAGLSVTVTLAPLTDFEDINQRLSQINDQFEAIAKQHGADIVRLPRLETTDGIHLTQGSYAAWARLAIR